MNCSSCNLLYVIIVVGLGLYFYAKWATNYFTRKGIKFIPYSFPLLGNSCSVLQGKEHIKDSVIRLYNAFPNEKYVGHMQFTVPLITIRDLDILKQTTVKDFDHFTNHFGGIDEDLDPLFGKNLFSLKGSKWRDMRATLSPAFTSSKIRNMFQFVEEIASQTAEFYMKEMESPENKERGLLEIEMRDAFTKYANDVIATTAFGIKINSLTDKDNEFYKKGKIATDFSGFVMLKMLFLTSFPFLSKLFGIKLFTDSTSNFFRHLVLNTMKTRDDKKITRNDMIQLLMEAKKGSLKHDSNKNDENDAGFATTIESHIGKQAVKRDWTDDDLVAQALLFFLAGFDSSSTLLCFMAHELTINPDIQAKLQNEIDQVISEKGAKLDYNDLTKMKYMDMVVSETLRMWPPTFGTNRQCVKPYNLPPPNDSSTKEISVNVDDCLFIPIIAIHHDPKYFPNPEKFDPERFSDENKPNINPFTFIPFGVGPRNCIGSRFALMEAKSVIFHLLAKFDFVETAKTQNPIKIAVNSFSMNAEKGFWIGLKPRHN